MEDIIETKYLKWDGTIIGKIQRNHEGKLKYLPQIPQIRELSRIGMPCHLIIMPQFEWADKLPEFVDRLLNNDITLDKDRFTIEST